LQLLVLAPESSPLVDGLLLVHLELVPPPPCLLPELEVTLALPQHVINAVDCVLDVFGTPTEQVANCRYSIALLGASDVLQVVHQGCKQELLLVIRLWVCRG
jgi:hypothetical protein